MSVKKLQGTDLKIAVCILHYGEPSLTQRLHRQLLNAEPKQAGHIYVLDNAAPQPYQQAWRRLPANLYWTGALEYASAEFSKAGYTHIWFLNNDILFHSQPPHIARAAGRLARLEQTFGRVGIYAPSVRANPYHSQMVSQGPCECRLVSYVDGIAPLISLECLQEIGGLDALDNPFGYGVDIWLGLRAKKANWLVVVDNQLVLRHTYHSTAKQVKGFLEQAALAQHNFLSSRLGPDYQNFIQEQQKECLEIPSL